MIGAPMNISDDARAAEQFRGTYVSANLFRMIGVKPMIGRDFADQDDQIGAEPVMILGNGIWKKRYAGDPKVIGQTIKANSKAYTVIAVMPPGLQFPNNEDLWLPLAMLPNESRSPRRTSATTTSWDGWPTASRCSRRAASSTRSASTSPSCTRM